MELQLGNDQTGNVCRISMEITVYILVDKPWLPKKIGWHFKVLVKFLPTQNYQKNRTPKKSELKLWSLPKCNVWFLQNVLICIIIIFLAGENLWLFWTLRLSDEAFIMKGRNMLSSDIWRHTLYLNHLSYSTALFKSFNTFDATNHEQ